MRRLTIRTMKIRSRLNKSGLREKYLPHGKHWQELSSMAGKVEKLVAACEVRNYVILSAKSDIHSLQRTQQAP